MKGIGLTKTFCLIATFCLAGAIALRAQTVTTVLQFDALNGWNPSAPLIQGADGNLWGTTEFGGEKTVGNVFAITTAGAVQHAYGSCTAANCPEVPEAPLVRDSNGNFYGTTEDGVTNESGTVFKITPTGHLTTLYNFCSQTNCTDGYLPTAGLVLGVNGNFYGTTTKGGISNIGGIVFEITPGGRITTLYNFCSILKGGFCLDGDNPSGGLVLGSDGNFYGATEYGGAKGGLGSIFKITPTGQLRQIYSFCVSSSQCSDGYNPVGTLIEGNDGNFYGMTYYGGTGPDCPANIGGCGTVFKITPNGTLTTLYNFCSQANCADGQNPVAGLVQGTDGNFYGTTYYGGGNSNSSCHGSTCGTLFKITPAGAFTHLYSFCSQSECSDGGVPSSALMQATDGTFFGTTYAGGITANICFGNFTGCGTVYSLSMGLGPFVEANPNFSRVGQTVGILGNNLTGTTSVTFNGVAAIFTVAADTYISATVPTGATTGTIQVTTPTGTLNSNVAFQVLP